MVGIRVEIPVENWKGYGMREQSAPQMEEMADWTCSVLGTVKEQVTEKNYVCAERDGVRE